VHDGKPVFLLSLFSGLFLFRQAQVMVIVALDLKQILHPAQTHIPTTITAAHDTETSKIT